MVRCESWWTWIASSLWLYWLQSNGHSLGMALLTSCRFSQQKFHFLAFPTLWGLHCTFSLIVLRTSLLSSLLGLLGLSLKFGWNLPWLHKSCIVHASKTSIIWTMLRSAVNKSSSKSPLDHGCIGLWMFEMAKHDEMDSRRPFSMAVTWTLFSTEHLTLLHP